MSYDIYFILLMLASAVSVVIAKLISKEGLNKLYLKPNIMYIKCYI